MFEISKTIALITIILNILAIAGFSWIKKYLRRESTSEFASLITVGMGAVFALYIITLTTLLIFSITSKHYIFALMLLIPLILPFILSYVSTYEKAHLFINLQILTLIFSLFLTSLIFMHTNADIIASNQIAKLTDQPRRNVLFYLKNDVTAKARSYNAVFKKFGLRTN